MNHNIIYSIIHISDLHFGVKSIANESTFRTSFTEFYSLLKDTIKKVISEYSIKLVMISGDITSKGKVVDLHNEHLKDFLHIFIENKIPICIANGNHDLNRDSIESNSQFNDFINFMKKNKKKFKTKLSKNFKENQASFEYLKEYNSIFIAINSCKNIEKRYIDEEIKDLNVKDINKYLDKQFLDVGVLLRKDLSELIKELERIYGQRVFECMNKFLICHHPLENLAQNKISINFLEENRINLIFSGHKHDYYYWSNQVIQNIGVGSLLADIKSRKDIFSLNEIPVQFNIYKINLSKETITPIVFFYNKNRKWEFEEEKIITFNVIHYYPIEQWYEVHQIRENKRNKLNEYKIVDVYLEKKENSGPPLTFFDSKGKSYRGFLVKEIDTQGYIDQIKKWYINNYNSVKSGNIKLLIVKNTSDNRFLGQLPDDYVI